jgi:predicted ATPase/class 3 adenylate cyclase
VATIILADVKGSTDLLESVGSETWVEMMNQIFQILEGEIYRFDGRVDQFRGDGLVAFFGTTTAHEDDPERAVLASLAMQRALKPYSDQLAEEAGIDLALRIGVNTGEVIVTSVGDYDKYSEETAMGEAIAIAARMEEAAEPGTVLVSENTYHLVDQQFKWKSLGEIRVKGIQNPITVYQPLSLRESLDRPQDYELASPLIGRNRQLQSLLDCVEDLQDGMGGIVTVTGDQGMGKSLLVSHMHRHIARQRALRAEVQTTDPGAPLSDSARDELEIQKVVGDSGLSLQVFKGRARSYDQSQPYGMWQDLLRNWLGIRQDEPQAVTRDRLREQARVLWQEQMVEFYPELATFLGLPLEPTYAEQIKHLDAEGLRQQIFVAVRSWLEEIAQDAQIIINFSDMHWADATSLDLLRYCLPLCDYLDLMWLLVFRPDRLSPTWEFQHYVETEYPHRLVQIHLPPLDTELSEAFIDEMIGPDVLPRETQSLIIEKAEGNPYYIQELLRSLIADNVLIRREGPDDEGEAEERWHATQAVTSISLPDSLQSLLMARIDRLSSDQQRVLQIAAVIGPVFWSDVLEDLAKPETSDLKSKLTALQRGQFITERGRTSNLGIEYIFKSKLIRDAAYESLLKPQRKTYHLQIARYLEDRLQREETSSQARSVAYGSLAHHYRQAGRLDKELQYTLKNAELAKDLYANVEASKLYAEALALLDELQAKTEDDKALQNLKAQKLQILMGRYSVHHLLGEFDQMRADAEALLPLARDLSDDLTWVIDALLCQPGVGKYEHREEIVAGMDLAREALGLAQQIEDRERELRTLVAMTHQHLALSDPNWQDLAERALALAREMKSRRCETQLLIDMGGVYAFSDEPERSMEYLEAAAALAMSEGLEDRLIQMSLLNLLGLEYERQGDYYRLLTEYQQERLHASREIGHRPMESQALQACGRIVGIYLGDYVAGLGALEDCRRILKGTRDEVYPLMHIAQIQISQANHADAGQTLEEIDAIGEPIRDRAKGSLRLVRALFHNAHGARAASRGNTDQVKDQLNESLTLADEVVNLAESSPMVSRQYVMGAMCKSVTAHLGLAQMASDSTAKSNFLQQAIDAAERAYEIYQFFGFSQIVECPSEEVLFRYSQALAANDQTDLAIRYLRRAYDELTRKHALIPVDSSFRRTYLEQIPLHREIRAAYATRVGSILGKRQETKNPAD